MSFYFKLQLNFLKNDLNPTSSLLLLLSFAWTFQCELWKQHFAENYTSHVDALQKNPILIIMIILIYILKTQIDWVWPKWLEGTYSMPIQVQLLDNEEKMYSRRKTHNYPWLCDDGSLKKIPNDFYTSLYCMYENNLHDLQLRKRILNSIVYNP